MEPQAVRWTIKVSKDTDLTLRTFLGSQGMKKGDLSKFIEEAVRRRVLQCTIQDIRTRNANADPDEIQRMLPLSQGGKADYLATGDKSGLLALGRHEATKIISARQFAALLV